MIIHSVPLWRRSLFPVLLIIAPLVLEAVCIWRYGVNVPTTDEWAFVPFVEHVRRNQGWLPMLFAQHNEHRIVTLRLVVAASVWFLGWNNLAIMYTTLGIVALTLLGLWQIYRGVSSNPWGFVPIAWLLCCLIQYQIVLWAMQLAFALVCACAVWALYLVGCRSRWTLVCAALLGIVGTFSAAAGALIWPAGIVVLWARRAGIRAYGFWVGFAVAVGAVYTWGYVQPNDNALLSASADVRQMARFALTALGAPLGAGSRQVALAIGLFLVGMLGLLLVQHIHDTAPGERAAALLGLIAFGTGAVALLTVGRFQKGIEWALVSRYTTMTLLVIIGLVMLALRRLRTAPHTSWPSVALLPVVGIGVCASTIYGWQQAELWAQQNRLTAFVAWTHATQPDEALTAAWIDADTSATSRARIATLQNEQLSLFRDPIDWWLLTRWQDGKPLGEIVPKLPVVQQFTCPVATLRDLAVVFATYQRANSGTLLLQLREDVSSTVLATRTLPNDHVRDNGWVFLPLGQPLVNCAGKVLQIEISTPDAPAGSATTAWSYPAYYTGTLRQGETPIVGRSLGLEMNTQTYHIRQGQ